MAKCRFLFFLSFVFVINCNEDLTVLSPRQKIDRLNKAIVDQYSSWDDIKPLLEAEKDALKKYEIENNNKLRNYYQTNIKKNSQELNQLQRAFSPQQGRVRWSPDGKQVSEFYKKYLDRKQYLEAVKDKLQKTVRFIQTIVDDKPTLVDNLEESFRKLCMDSSPAQITQLTDDGKIVTQTIADETKNNL